MECGGKRSATALWIGLDKAREVEITRKSAVVLRFAGALHIHLAGN